MSIYSFDAHQGETISLVPSVSPLENTWNISSAGLSHNFNVKSEITKHVPSLKINGKYLITYEVYGLVSCTVQLRVGADQLGSPHAQNGIYSEFFIINSEADRDISFLADGILKIRNISYTESVYVTVPISLKDDTLFENKSWTKSFSLNNNSWLSYHSYLPNFYIDNHDGMYSTQATDVGIYKHDKAGDYQRFFGQQYPFILEYVAISSPLTNRIVENLSLQTKARKFDETRRQYIDVADVTFTHITAYNNSQSTGELRMIAKSANPASGWYNQQTVNKVGTIPISRAERNWNINDLRDNVIDYTQPLFTSVWAETKFNYFIDKIPNSSVISFTKPWNELQSFRDKYMVIRLKFDNFNDINLSLNYSVEMEQTSIR